jgi:hypothetical protein
MVSSQSIIQASLLERVHGDVAGLFRTRTFGTVTTETPRSRAMSFSRTAIHVPQGSSHGFVSHGKFDSLLAKARPAPQTPAASDEAQQQ